VLREADPVVAIVIAEARFGAGTHELYQVPIAVRPRSDGWDAGVISSTSMHVAYDALIDEAADAALAARFGDATAIDRPSGACASIGTVRWRRRPSGPQCARSPPSVEHLGGPRRAPGAEGLSPYRAGYQSRARDAALSRCPRIHQHRDACRVVQLQRRADGRDAGDHAALRSRRARRLGARARLARGRGPVVPRPPP